VTADSSYGDDRRLRMWLEAHEQAYVLAVSGREYVTVAATWKERRVSTLLQELQQTVPADAWQRLSAGDGAKGPRLYDWYRLPLVPPLQTGYERWCLVRRSLSDPNALQAYVAFAPEGTDLAPLVQVAGGAGRLRWPLKRPPRARWGWTTLRCAVGRGGIVISRWPCLPTPCSPSCAGTWRTDPPQTRHAGRGKGGALSRRRGPRPDAGGGGRGAWRPFVSSAAPKRGGGSAARPRSPQRPPRRADPLDRA
jgi:hypothetical protein